MAITPAVLKLDCASTEREILDFIAKVVAESGQNGVAVGLSGGIDSAVVGSLCVRALGKDRVVALLMPSDFTPSEDVEDAKSLAATWGIRTHVIKITPLALQLFSTIDIEGDRVAQGNAQARIRMVISYYYANSLKLLVAGTGDRSEELTGFFCYDSMTRVVTPNGPKGINELRTGDQVFSIDPLIGEMVQSEVNGVHVFDYDGQMIHFRGRGTDVKVTPNHRMLVHTSSSNPNSRLVFRRADECLESRDVLTPVPVKWSGDANLPVSLTLEFSQRHIRRTARIPVEEAFYLFGLFIGDGSVTKGKAVIPVKTTMNRVEYTATHRGIGGRVVPVLESAAEGRMKEYDTYETDFALPDYTKDIARKKLCAILEKYEIGYSLTRDSVRISSKGIYQLFAQCGIGARSKRIPEWLLRYPSRYLAYLLQGLRDSDGSQGPGNHYYYTSSERLKDDFVQLCFKLGRRASVTLVGAKKPMINGKVINTGPAFVISYSSSPRAQHALKSQLARRVVYKGKVWCPSVPPYENILVERNGKYVFSGNTKFGDGGVDFMPVAHLYKSQVRELGRHLGIPQKIVNKAPSPRLWPGHLATDELPVDYGSLDLILYGLHDAKLPPDVVAKQVGVGVDTVDAVVKLNRDSMHKRAFPPMVRPW